MNMNEMGGKEIERMPGTEREISKIKELTAAPVEAQGCVADKKKLEGANNVVSERIEQRKEVQAPAAETKQPEMKQPEEKRFTHDFAEFNDELNRMDKGPSFGSSEKICRDSHTNQNYCKFSGSSRR